MLKIGVLSPKNSGEIVDTLVMLMKNINLLVAVKKNAPNNYKDINFYEECGIEYCIIIFDKNTIHPVKLDILILDNESNLNLVNYDLIECMKEKTILIYNTDNNTLPLLNHPNAIDYGYCTDRTVSISSIDYNENELSFIISIQREFEGLYSNKFDIGEFLIKSKYIANVTNILPAVICCMVCGVISYDVVKI